MKGGVSVTTGRADQMSLVLFHSPVGRFTHSWRRPTSGVEELLSVELAARSARLAQAAKFDAIFLADKVVHDEAGLNPDTSTYEPTTTLGALSAVTDHIGLIATISTTFSQPYNTARVLTQLDHLSKGRIGWNVVTSASGGQNFNGVMPPKAER